MELPGVVADQSGVVARQQLLAGGWTDADIRRARRRRELVAVLPGVFVDHTGTPTWMQRAWVAVLATSTFDGGVRGGSALAQESALRVADGPGRRGQDDGRIIHVAVGEERRIGVLPRVRVHRMRHLHERAQLHLHPPRVRYDDALLDVAAGETDRLGVMALLADAVGSRRTTTRRLLAVVDRRSRLSNRGWLRSVLEDIAAGTCSVLEHAYLRDVERAHGLPPAIRQQRVVTAGRVTYRDACYGGVVVELDGRRFHDSAQARDADLDRDLSAAANGELTVRLGWGQVFGRPCETAMALIKILRAAGVSVAPTPCGPECPVADSSYRAPR